MGDDIPGPPRGYDGVVAVEIGVMGFAILCAAYQFIATVLSPNLRRKIQTVVLGVTLFDSMKYLTVYFLLSHLERHKITDGVVSLLFNFFSWFHYAVVLLWFAHTYFLFMEGASHREFVRRHIFKIFLAILAVCGSVFVGGGCLILVNNSMDTFITIWNAIVIVQDTSILMVGLFFVRHVAFKMDELMFNDKDTYVIAKRARMLALVMAFLLITSIALSISRLLGVTIESLTTIVGPQSYKAPLRILLYDFIPVITVAYTFSPTMSVTKIFMVEYKSSTNPILGPAVRSTRAHTPQYGSTNQNKSRPPVMPKAGPAMGRPLQRGIGLPEGGPYMTSMSYSPMEHRSVEYDVEWMNSHAASFSPPSGGHGNALVSDFSPRVISHDRRLTSPALPSGNQHHAHRGRNHHVGRDGRLPLDNRDPQIRRDIQPHLGVRRGADPLASAVNVQGGRAFHSGGDHGTSLTSSRPNSWGQSHISPGDKPSSLRMGGSFSSMSIPIPPTAHKVSVESPLSEGGWGDQVFETELPASLPGDLSAGHSPQFGLLLDPSKP